MPEYQMPLKTVAGTQSFNVLDEFTRAYVEALCWTECNPDNDQLDGLGFDDMQPETVAAAVTDCAEFQRDNADTLARAYESGTRHRSGASYDESSAGHDFWLTRNRHGAGFWDRGLPDDIGKELSAAARTYGEVYIDSGDFISPDERPMSPNEAWLYAATWGSAMTSGDPGACMYGFDETCRPQSEAHRADVLAWIADCRLRVVDKPGDYDDDELQTLDSFVTYMKQAKVEAV